MGKPGIVAYLFLVLVATAAAALAVQNLVERPSAADTAKAPVAAGAQYAVTIHVPDPPAGVETGLTNRQGEAVRLACRHCHEIRQANPRVHSGTQLQKFHQGLEFRHAKLSCIACHNAEDGYTTLHLADGSSLQYADTMQLCAQCHGTQYRDYQHGSHGGMTGYWDLSKGPRQRNHCVDCHDPHAPQFPMMYPAPGPQDRFAPAHAAHKKSIKQSHKPAH